MTDLNLITILPPQQLSGVQSSPLPPGITSHGTSPLLAVLPAGTVLKGFIVNRDAAGNPVLRTDRGDILFSTNFFLKIGSEVVIRIGNTAGTPQAHIITVDGQPPEIAQNVSAFAQDTDVVVNSQQPRAQSDNQLNAATPVNIRQQPTLRPSSTVTGTVIAPSYPVSATQTAQSVQTVPAGTQLGLKVITIEVPSAPAQAVKSTPAIAQPSAPLPASTVSYATYARVAATTSPIPATTMPIISQDPSAAIPSQTLSGIAAPQAGNTIAVTSSVLPAQPAAPQQGVLAHTVITAAPAAISAATAQYVSFSNAIAASSSTLLAARELPFGLPGPLVVSPHFPAALQSLLSHEIPVVPGTVAITPIITPAQKPLAPAMPVTLQTGATVTGKVIGHETTGEMLVQTNAGVVRLPAGSAPIPAGSTITFAVTNVRPPIAAGIPADAKPAPLPELAQQWTSLQQIFTHLGDKPTPTGLEGLLLASSAQPGQHTQPREVTGQAISSGLLLFIAALRGGNFRNWLGEDNARWLDDHGNANLLKKAEAEFLGLSRHYTEAAPHHWQPLFFPVAVDGILQQVRLFVKRDRKQSPGSRDSKTGDDTRFIIEIDLTQLGELQMDGFVRKQEKGLQFDMVIRSLMPLSKEIQDDILKMYTSTGALTGYKGSLTFQAVKAFPANPMEEIVAGGGPVVA